MPPPDSNEEHPPTDAPRPRDPAPAVLADIAERLGPACSHMPARDFAELVLRIARTKARFADQERSLPGLSGLWDPPPLDPPAAEPGAGNEG